MFMTPSISRVVRCYGEGFLDRIQYHDTTKRKTHMCSLRWRPFLISHLSSLYDSDSAHVSWPVYAQFTYLNNSAVPLLLTLRGTDVQALDLFANAPALQLLRTVVIGSEAVDENGVRRSNNTVRLLAARRAAASCDPGVRVLRGGLFALRGVQKTVVRVSAVCMQGT